MPASVFEIGIPPFLPTLGQLCYSRKILRRSRPPVPSNPALVLSPHVSLEGRGEGGGGDTQKGSSEEERKRSLPQEADV